MKQPILALLLVTAIAGIALAKQDNKTPAEAANLTRAGFPKIGAATITLAATTSLDADSGALQFNAVYMLRCDTDAWIRWGASAVTAASGDWKVGAGEVYYFATGGSQALVHVSALSVSANGSCRLIELL